jgi:hypothetical protein
VDRLLTDMQPRLDSLLRRVESRISELRRDLEERAARTADRPAGTLPPPEGEAPAGPAPAAGPDEEPPAAP